MKGRDHQSKPIELRFVLHNEFRHFDQDQTQSGLPKFVTENGWLRVNFPSRIWETWTGSDTIRFFIIRDGKWLAEGGFSKFGKSGQD